MLRSLIKFILSIIIILYLVIATYFAWQYFKTPELSFCLEYPSASLMSSLPQSWQESQFLASTSAELQGIVTQSKKALEIGNWLRDQMRVSENASASADLNVLEKGQYLYCQKVVTEWEQDTNTVDDNLNSTIEKN